MNFLLLVYSCLTYLIKKEHAKKDRKYWTIQYTCCLIY
jgi:hypothetical protein